MHQCKKFYGVGTIGEKGQIVVPIEARDELKIKTGDKFVFFGVGEMLHMIEAEKLNDFLDKMTAFSSRMVEMKEDVKKKIKESK
jgi:AbrB family looped-hinge helix DNA binding protein